MFDPSFIPEELLKFGRCHRFNHGRLLALDYKYILWNHKLRPCCEYLIHRLEASPYVVYHPWQSIVPGSPKHVFYY